LSALTNKKFLNLFDAKFIGLTTQVVAKIYKKQSVYIILFWYVNREGGKKRKKKKKKSNFSLKKS
jgi:hypothetical protein